jgi:hypothetical protein
MRRDIRRHRTDLSRLFIFSVIFPFLSSTALADNKGENSFAVVISDAEGVDTELKNLLFYWEDKISETAFVPHELKHVPVKRGTATVHLKFEIIKQIDVTTTQDKTFPLLTITLTNGKTGAFMLGIAGSFTGESDFGELELPANGIKKIVFA